MSPPGHAGSRTPPPQKKRKTQKEKAKGSEGRLEAEAAARTGAARPPESSVAPAASGAPRRCGAALPGAGGQGRGRGGTAEGERRRVERTERGKVGVRRGRKAFGGRAREAKRKANLVEKVRAAAAPGPPEREKHQSSFCHVLATRRVQPSSAASSAMRSFQCLTQGAGA